MKYVVNNIIAFEQLQLIYLQIDNFDNNKKF